MLLSGSSLRQVADALGVSHQTVPGYYGQRAVLLLQAFLLLARVRNPERLRYEQPGAWGRLMGLDRSCAPDTRRRKLGELAVGEDAVGAWREQLARQWVSAAAAAVATLFVDGHVQVYHGKANLPKHFVSRDRQVRGACGHDAIVSSQSAQGTYTLP